MELRVIEEPVDSNPYLDLFYKDPKTYAFGMQIFLLHRRYAMQQLASYECTTAGQYAGAVLDRSLSGDRVFAKMHREAGNIHEIDWHAYEEAYSIMARSLLPPTLLIFLDVQPKTAFERMKQRNRGAEAGVAIEYLIKLREGYQALLHEAETGLMPWAHAVRVARLVWDPETISSGQWDAVSQTVKDACRVGW